MLIILGFLFQTLRYLVIYYFSPNLLIITDIIRNIINLFTIDIYKKDIKDFYNYGKIIWYIIIFIFALIYNKIKFL